MSRQQSDVRDVDLTPTREEDIREYGKDRPRMSRGQVDRIVEVIVANNKEQKTISKVDSEAIIEDYATLVVMLNEGAEDLQEETVQNMKSIELE